jgi:hypothetical protein
MESKSGPEKTDKVLRKTAGKATGKVDGLAKIVFTPAPAFAMRSAFCTY